VTSAPLYPDPPRFFFNNYPPIAFYVLALSSADHRTAFGRSIALVSFAFWTILIAATAHAMGCTRAEAAFGAALFAATMFGVSSYVGMSDPQMLGHVAQWIALWLVARSRRPSTLVAAAALLTAGVFTKDSLLALPLALAAWLWTVDRRAARTFTVAGVTVAAIAWAGCTMLYGPAFAREVLAPRDFAIADVVRATVVWCARMAAFLALVVFLVRRVRRDEAAAFAVLYVTLAAAIGLALVGGAGVDWNVLFDANAGCCLAAAIAIHRLEPRRRSLAVVALVALPIGAAVASFKAEWLTRAYWLAPRAVEASAASREVAWIRAQDGPALCHQLAFCFDAGKPEEADVANLQQRLERDPDLARAFVGRIDDRYYAVIQLDAAPPRLGSAFDAALARAYVVDHRNAFGSFLVRRGPERASASTAGPR
jgi:hypothetical protein